MSFRIKSKRLAPVAQTQKADLHILDYTDRSIVVMGDTIPHSQALAELGGKYNAQLKIGAGWIFSKARKESVEKYIKTGKVERFEFDKAKFAKPGNKPEAIGVSERQLRKLFREFRAAFDSDEEYEGSSVLEVIDQLEQKYTTQAAPKPVTPSDSVDVEQGSPEAKSSDSENEASDVDFADIM